MVPGSGGSGVFSADGDRLATRTHLWDVNEGRELAAFDRGLRSPHITRSSSYPREIAWSADGKLLASAHHVYPKDATVVIWDSRTGKQKMVCQSEYRPQSALRLRFSPDGMYLAGCHSHGVSLWETATGKEVSFWRVGSVVGFSPDGTRLVAFSNSDHHDRSALLLDVASKKIIAELPGAMGGATYAAAFTPDSTRLVTGHSKGVVRFWDSSDGAYLCECDSDLDTDVEALALSPDGKRVFIGPGRRGGTTVLGVSKAEIALARIAADEIEARMKERVAEWVAAGPEAARASLEAAKRELPPEEYRVVRNMVLAALVAAPARKP
jgi:WD40 repeat protein